jgi:hypothetical protein
MNLNFNRLNYISYQPFDGTFAFLPKHKAKQKNAKEPPNQRTTTRQWRDK